MTDLTPYDLETVAYYAYDLGQRAYQEVEDVGEASHESLADLEAQALLALERSALFSLLAQHDPIRQLFVLNYPRGWRYEQSEDERLGGALLLGEESRRLIDDPFDEEPEGK